jgi:N-acyl-D-amino-acid deacylase
MSELDVCIRGALVVDGSGAPGRVLDVGISGDRIAALGSGLTARRVVEGRGLVASPGFVDAHSHSDLSILSDPQASRKLRQGVTFELLGQDGLSVAPVAAESVGDRGSRLRGLLGTFEPWTWTTLEGYFGAIERAAPAHDVGYLVPHGAVRESALGMSTRPATDEELGRMRAELARALRAGGMGLSTGLVYPPCSYADDRELTALCEEASAFGRPLVVHLRSEGAKVLEAVEEMLSLARRTRVPLHISHLKVSGPKNWALATRLAEMLLRASGEGIALSADLYPYTEGSTLLSALVPPWVHEGGAQAACARIADPAQRPAILDSVVGSRADTWDNPWVRVGADRIVLASHPLPEHAVHVGRSLTDSARALGTSPADFVLDRLVDGGFSGSIILHSQSEEVMEMLLGSLPFVSLCTDGLVSGGSPHPRAAGAFARVLGRLVRVRRVLSLEDAVHRMSGLPARTFKIEDQGLLREGHRANLVLFDPSSVEDRATFAQPLAPPVGIPFVMVGGQVVLDGGEVTGFRPGRVHRAAMSASS